LESWPIDGSPSGQDHGVVHSPRLLKNDFV